MKKVISILVAMLLVMAAVAPAMASCPYGSGNEKGVNEAANVLVGNSTELTGAAKSEIIDMALKNSQVKELQKQMVAEGFAQKDIKAYTVPVTLEDGSVVEIQATTIQFESPDGEVQYLSFAYNTQTGESMVVLGLWSCVECLAIIILGGFGCTGVCVTAGVLTIGVACAACIVAAASIALCPCYDCCCATAGFDSCCDTYDWLCT